MATKHETGAVKIPKRRSLERPNWAAGVLSTLWLLVVVVPLYIMVKASIEDKPHYSEEGPLSLPTMFTLDNYTNALDQDSCRHSSTRRSSPFRLWPSC